MQGRSRALVVAVVLCLGATVVGEALMAAGFGIFEQGAKGMGMGGAFTATADDPSAMFHNVGGLALLDEREFQLGATLITSDGSEFMGAGPFPGDGVLEHLESISVPLPHFYWVEPINDRWTFGLAVNSPFGLVTEWDPEGFSGRFITVKGELKVLDFNPNLGWKVSDRVGIGFGLMVRFAEVALERRQGLVNPFTGQVVDIADVALESDTESGTGWQFGFLNRVNNSFSWGFSYRSEIEIDYVGDARFTQISTGNPQLDALVAATLPFGQSLPISTTLKAPAMASLGVAVALSRNWRLEIDANWTDWDVFQEVVVNFEGALPDLTIPQNWDDSNNYRAGLRWLVGPRTEWRFGYIFDETPQPEETLGPLLPDGDRDGYAIGFGYEGDRFSLDLALSYIDIEERTTLVNSDGYNGTWITDGILFASTFGW
jgi:long-chain fatty acid transport protein